MERISYRGLEMTIIQTLDIDKEPMFDASNTTYECTRIRASFVCTLNPGAVSFKANPGNAGLLPIATDGGALTGKMPAETEESIRRFLEQPRGQLIIESAGRRWLVCPRDFRNGPMRSDVRGGPFTKATNIQRIQGERCWRLLFVVECYVNESPEVRSTSFPPLFLSNRWWAADTVNWQHLRTRVYSGTCTVRGDVLQHQDPEERYIDAFREQFMAFTVPFGFQRESVQVTVTPDGNTAHYTVVDVEQIFHKSINSPAVRLEVADTNFTSISSQNNLILSGLRSNWLLLDFLSGENKAERAMQVSAPALSKMHKNILVRAWGNNKTPRETLLSYAMAIALTRMGTLAFFDTTLSELVVSGDSQNFVQCSYTIKWGQDCAFDFFGGLGSALFNLSDQGLFGGNFGPGQAAFRRSISQSPETFGLPGGTRHGQARQDNPPFPGSRGTRGTAATYGNNPLFCLVTQALESFDAEPADVRDLPV